MSADGVQALLGDAGLGHYWDLFNELGIDSTSFPLLTLQDLYSLGVDNVSDRKRMFQLIVDTRNKESSGAAPAPARGGDADFRVVQVSSEQRDLERARDERRHKEEQQRRQDDREARRREREEQRLEQRAIAKHDVPLAQRAPPAVEPEPVRDVVKPSSVVVPKNERIKVCVRKRPINRREVGKGEGDIVTVSPGSNSICVHEPKIKVDLQKFIEKHQFRFDVAFDENCNNADVYARTAAPLVESIFEGVNATCFAYGQTGSGKTHTMMGPPTEDSRSPNRGIIVFAATDMFERLQTKPDLSLCCSFFEIYSGKLFDLLNDRRSLAAREDGKQNVVIVGLQEKEVASVDELLALIDYGNTVRSTGQTGANADSSRSHAIIRMRLVGPKLGKGKKRTEIGKFHFIDLAGSERGVDTQSSSRQTRMEGAEINKSLLALKECIRAMDLESAHLPFRGSKLTQVLKDSFRGSSARTVMIANIGPNSGAAEHTLNTLRYSDRVKELKGEGKGRDKAGQANAYALGGGIGAQRGNDERAQRRDDQRPAYPAGGHDPSKMAAAEVRSDPAAELRLEALMAAEKQAEEREQRYKGGGGRSDACHDSPDPANIDFSAKQPLAASLSAHELLIDTILTKQDELVEAHRQQIDDIMEMVKEEMEVLRMADAPGAEIDVYVNRLDKVLDKKMSVIANLREKLNDFRGKLQEEENLNQSRTSLSFK